jgi:Bacterial regulatory proteins, luxR family
VTPQGFEICNRSLLGRETCAKFSATPFFVTSKQAAEKAGLSEITAKVHRGNVMKKMARAHSRIWFEWPTRFGNFWMHRAFAKRPVSSRTSRCPGSAVSSFSKYSTMDLHIPMIFITAYPDQGIRKQAMDAGAICFLDKPFDGPTIVECIERALSRYI